jgi:hypothetical protein
MLDKGNKTIYREMIRKRRDGRGISMRFSAIFILFACVSPAFGQPGLSFYVSRTGGIQNPAPKLRPGAPSNMRLIPQLPGVPSMCGVASPTEDSCAKVTILEGGFETRVECCRRDLQGTNRRSCVKTRFCHQAETTPQVRQTRRLHRSHHGGSQAARRSSEAE